MFFLTAGIGQSPEHGVDDLSSCLGQLAEGFLPRAELGIGKLGDCRRDSLGILHCPSCRGEDQIGGLLAFRLHFFRATELQQEIAVAGGEGRERLLGRLVGQ